MVRAALSAAEDRRGSEPPGFGAGHRASRLQRLDLRGVLSALRGFIGIERRQLSQPMSCGGHS
eukprot:9330855-Alexandrium_andersonii.AAC.1